MCKEGSALDLAEGSLASLRALHTQLLPQPKCAALLPCAGRGMMGAVGDANKLRAAYPALRYGWSNCIHEDRANGVMG